MKNLIYGINSIYESLRHRPKDVIHITVSKGRTLKNIKSILDIASRHQIPVSYKDVSLAQGIIAEIKSQSEVSLDEVIRKLKEKNEKALILVLDEIEDPHNLGALVRSAACAGAHAVVIPKRGAAQVTPAVIKVSAGGTEHVPVCRVTNINYTLDQLKKEGFWTVGLALEGEKSLFESSYKEHTVFVIGNEERGLRRLVRESCDELVKIPMPGNMESLNASVAGAIALFEVLRQRFN